MEILKLFESSRGKDVPHYPQFHHSINVISNEVKPVAIYTSTEYRLTLTLSCLFTANKINYCESANNTMKMIANKLFADVSEPLLEVKSALLSNDNASALRILDDLIKDLREVT